MGEIFEIWKQQRAENRGKPFFNTPVSILIVPVLVALILVAGEYLNAFLASTQMTGNDFLRIVFGTFSWTINVFVGIVFLKTIKKSMPTYCFQKRLKSRWLRYIIGFALLFCFASIFENELRIVRHHYGTDTSAVFNKMFFFGVYLFFIILKTFSVLFMTVAMLMWGIAKLRSFNCSMRLKIWMPVLMTAIFTLVCYFILMGYFEVDHYGFNYSSVLFDFNYSRPREFASAYAQKAFRNDFLKNASFALSTVFSFAPMFAFVWSVFYHACNDGFRPTLVVAGYWCLTLGWLGGSYDPDFLADFILTVIVMLPWLIFALIKLLLMRKRGLYPGEYLSRGEEVPKPGKPGKQE